MKSNSWFKNYIVKSLLLAVLVTVSNAVLSQPAAKFSGNPVSGCAPILVRFTDESTGAPNYWKWDLGNGTISYLQHPSVTYFLPGLYSVKLLVKNAAGSDSIAKTGYVRVYAAPVVDFSAAQTSGCNTLSTTFLNTGSGGNSLQWDFGDGVLSNSSNPAHTYLQTGNYNVNLKVTNDEGCTSTLLKPAYISVNTVKAAFSNYISNGCKPTRINFQNNSSGTGSLRFKWLFGTGDSSSVHNPDYNYTRGGNYTVKLFVSNEFGCLDSISKNITVENPVSAAFSSDITTACKAPAMVHFSNQQLNGNVYTWTLGDTVIQGSNPVYRFADTGRYTVKLFVRNSNGCTDSLTKTDYIRIQKAAVSFGNLPDSGCFPFTKKLEAISVGSDAVTSYTWNFGDGETASGASPVHRFGAAGNYTVSLITTGLSGCRDTLVLENAVKAGSKPRAAFTAPVTTGCAQGGIQFNDQSTGSITSWEWNFGDNSQEVEQHPLHKFTDSGFLAVQLIVANAGCADSLKKENYVYIKPAISKFKYDFNCTDPFTFSFGNHSVGAERCEWNFGDGSTSTVLNPVHTYRDTGMYTVSLLSYNQATGCNYWLSKKILAVKIRPDFFADDTAVCKDQSVHFTSTILSDNASRFIWSFGDGTTESTHENSVDHIYDKPGRYSVSLTTINLINCRDTVVKTGYITVNGLKAIFDAAATAACANSTVVFSDSSTTSGSNSIRSWQWFYGDGQSQSYTEPPFEHTYTRAGNFIVSLRITDNEGCTDSSGIEIPLQVKKVSAFFKPSDTIKCTNTDIRFICPYSEQGVTYRWDFGDGQTASTQLPWHQYSNEGFYHVKLYVSQAGCTDSSVLMNAVHIENPVAAFSMSDSFRSCPPLIVQLTNHSSGLSEEMWDFGDGSSTSIHDPSHFYSYPGEYHPTLFVKGRGGCTVSMQKQIVVKGPKGTLSYTPLSFCSDSTVNFTAHTVDAVSYLWDFNDGVTIINTDSSVSHRYTNPGKYIPKLMLVDNKACKVPINGMDTIHRVSIKAAFDFPAKIFCSNQPVSFINGSQNSEAITTIRWNFGDGTVAAGNADAVHHYQLAGNYFPSLVITSAHGCRDSMVAALPIKVAIRPEAEMVSTGNGCTPLPVTFGSTISSIDAVDKWQWDFGNGKTSGEQNPGVQTYDQPGEFPASLTITTRGGCEMTVSKNIRAYALPWVNAGSDKQIRAGNTADLVPAVSADVTEVKWSPTQDIFRTSGNGITVKPGVNTEYTVEVKNINGCKSTDKISVLINNGTNSDTSSVFVPNTFSPDGDGINDVFYPRSAAGIKVTRFKIINRNGMVVFEKSNIYTNDVVNGWDGIYKGAKLPSDVYLYAIEMAGSDGKPYNLSGNITLLR